MKAAVQHAPFNVRVEDVPEPKPGLGEVKVKIAYCGICGTDPDIYDGSFGLMKAPWWPKGPFTVGHEASGVIAELGPGLVGDLMVGQRVAMNFRTYCGKCYYCRSAREHMCEHVTNYEGGFAEYAVYGEAAVYPLPDDVSLEHGAFLEPVTIAAHCVDQGDIIPGRTVAICGGGTIGLLVMQIAIRAGAARVVVSDPMPEKRELARKLGADWVVDPLADDLEAFAKGVTEGRGFDTVFECSGKLAAAKQCLGLADKCGTIVWAGVYPEEAELALKPFHLFANELTLRSTTLAPYLFPRGVKLLSKLDLDPLLSEICPLDDIDRALAGRKTSTAIKILVRP
jgi:(R,R)-butanediol dehydrogenase/meso-butanediol dehydrogenase/diacetyl reductase